MTVKDLIKALVELPMESEVVIDTDDSLEGNYKVVNTVVAKDGGIGSIIVVLEHKWV